MRGSRLAFGFLTEVTGKMVQMAENRLDIGQKFVLVTLCHLYEIRVKVSLNRAGEEKGKLIL